MRDDVVLVGVAHAVGVDHEALERAHLLGDGAPLEAEHHGGGSAAAVDGGTGPIAHLVARALPNAAGDVLHPGDDRLLHLLVRAEVARAHDDALRAVVLEALEHCQAQGPTDWAAIKSAIKNDLSAFLYKKTKRNPMILPVIMEV